MKKIRYLAFIAIILFLSSTIVLANNNLLTVPTASIGRNGYIYGEIVSSRKQVEMAYTINPQIEVGALLRENRKSAELGLVAKTVLAEETVNTPAVAVGIKNTDLYFVTSKYLGWNVNGHLGIGNGDLSGLFLGFNMLINPVSIGQDNRTTMPPISLIGEYANEKVNVGLRMRLQENMKFDIGLVSMDTLKLGLGYSF
ncbi:MAG: hypothetical protein ACOCRU_00150 [bacterium]